MKLFFALIFLSLTVFPARAGEQLNIFIWSEYLPDEVVEEFEQRFNCKIVIDLYEDAESMLAKIQSGGGALYDIVVPTDYLVPAMIQQKLLAPLRPENLPNVKNIESRFRNSPFDPENRYTVAYQWGTMGIFARKPEGQRLEESWALFFDPRKQPGPFVMIDSMRDLIPAALRYKGFSMNSTDTAELRSVRDLLVETKKRSLGFASSVAGKNKVLDKSARAAIVYSGEGVRGMTEDPETYYFIPREGSWIWVDFIAILAQAPHRDLAEKFINFVLEPEIGAKVSNMTQNCTPNKEARRFIDPDLLTNPALYPAEETMTRLVYAQHLGRQSRLYDQIWTSVKSR